MIQKRRSSVNDLPMLIPEAVQKELVDCHQHIMDLEELLYDIAIATSRDGVDDPWIPDHLRQNIVKVLGWP